MTAAYEGKLIVSTKKDPAFLQYERIYLLEGSDYRFQEARGQPMSRGNKRSYQSASQAGE